MFLRSYILQITFILVFNCLSFSASADIDSPAGVQTFAQGMDTVVLEGVDDVPGAVSELIAKLERQGFDIPLTVNHSGAAASVNMDLAPNQVVFARPPRILEKRLLRKSDTIGLDLPLKFLIFEDNDGKIKLSVNTLGYLADRHEVRIGDVVLQLTDRLISQFGSSGGEGQGLISIKSAQTFTGTVQALQDTIALNPAVSIPLVLDYGNGGKKQGNGRYRNSSPVLVVFGSPNIGTPLMQADPRIGIDLPLKFLVWEDRQGRVNITYNNLHFIAGRFNLMGHNDRLDAIAGTLDNIAQGVAGR